MRFDVRDYAPVVATPRQHDGECMVDETYDGEACCPLGDVEQT